MNNISLAVRTMYIYPGLYTEDVTYFAHSFLCGFIECWEVYGTGLSMVLVSERPLECFYFFVLYSRSDFTDIKFELLDRYLQ